MMPKYHITARGSVEHPDLDCDVDEVPSDLYSKYRYIDVAMLTPVSHQAIKESLVNFGRGTAENMANACLSEAFNRKI